LNKSGEIFTSSERDVLTVLLSSGAFYFRLSINDALNHMLVGLRFWCHQLGRISLSRHSFVVAAVEK
jgi:hypothetical protein